jgi:engulfment/cell motility protein 1
MDLIIVDLSIISSVVSNISASSADSTRSDSTLKILPHDKATTTNTKITIHGYLPTTEDVASRVQQSRQTNYSHSRQASKSSNATHNQPKESVLLTLYPQSHSVASEWLDGLLMLLNQQPITAETNKLINIISSYGLKIRLLNVRFDEKDMLGEAPEIPSREGLDEDYYYDL